MTDLFRPKHVATIIIADITYDYYVVEYNRLALVEEKATLKLIRIPGKWQIHGYQIPHTVKLKPLYKINLTLPLGSLSDPLKFTLDDYHITIDKIHAKGGEAIIYKGTINQQQMIFKSYLKGPRTVRALPPELKPYLPRKYLLFEDLSRAYVIAMELLEGLVYSTKIYKQSLEFLNLLESLNEVHGDISPGNLLQDSEGNLRVIDFGRPRTRGTPFYSIGHTDRQALARSLLGYKYSDLIKKHTPMNRVTLRKIYVGYQNQFQGSASEEQFFRWFQDIFPQDEESLQLLAMAR